MPQLTQLSRRRTNYGSSFRLAGNWLILVVLLVVCCRSARPVEAAPPNQPVIPAGCYNLVLNGGFESGLSNWTPQGIVVPDSAVKTSGNFSARLGITADALNQQVSSTLTQQIFLPVGSYTIRLYFNYFPQFNLNIVDADEQFVNIRKVSDGNLIPVVPATKQNSPVWLSVNDFPLDALSGQQIQLVFGVNNDGVASKTLMYVDDVFIIVCPVPPTATPTSTITPIPSSPTPTVTTTPLPAGCTTDTILNGGFEDDFYWIFGDVPVPGAYESIVVRTGLRAVRLGIDPALGPHVQHKESFSSIRQPFQISPFASTAQLTWWHFDRSEEAPVDPVIPAMGPVDRQEVVLLYPDQSTARVLYQKRLNGGAWVQTTVDLTAFRGQPLLLYFNVFNDGNGLRTWQYLDDVEMIVCYPPTPTPTNTSPPTNTPTITPTPTDTSTPTNTPTDTVTPMVMPLPAPAETTTACGVRRRARCRTGDRTTACGRGRVGDRGCRSTFRADFVRPLTCPSLDLAGCDAGRRWRHRPADWPCPAIHKSQRLILSKVSRNELLRPG